MAKILTKRFPTSKPLPSGKRLCIRFITAFRTASCSWHNFSEFWEAHGLWIFHLVLRCHFDHLQQSEESEDTWHLGQRYLYILGRSIHVVVCQKHGSQIRAGWNCWSVDQNLGGHDGPWPTTYKWRRVAWRPRSQKIVYQEPQWNWCFLLPSSQLWYEKVNLHIILLEKPSTCAVVEPHPAPTSPSPARLLHFSMPGRAGQQINRCHNHITQNPNQHLTDISKRYRTKNNKSRLISTWIKMDFFYNISIHNIHTLKPFFNSITIQLEGSRPPVPRPQRPQSLDPNCTRQPNRLREAATPHFRCPKHLRKNRTGFATSSLRC